MAKTEFAYTAKVVPVYDDYFRWKINVYREEGTFVKSAYTVTKWGAKMEAKKLAYNDAQDRVKSREGEGFTLNFTVKVKS